MLKIWYSFLLCLLSLQLEANPGLKVRITQKGLDYGKRIGMELLKEAILKETFPSWSGQESFAFVKVNYRISGLRINAVDFPETSASFIPGTGIRLSVTRASATMSADWGLRTWLLRGQGGITVSISGLFMAVVFEVSRDSTGHLSVLLHNCQLIINSVKVQLNGGSSWVYKFLTGYLQKAIHTKLDKNLCLDIKYKIQMLDAQLRKLKVLSQIDAFAQIDYSLVSSPAVFKSHLNLDLKGTVYAVGNHRDPPFMPAPFALPNRGDSMLYLGVSNYFLKSASLAYYRAGVFNITISQELATAFNLTTALFKKFVPEMALHYVTEHPVLLKLMATSPPEVSLQADGCSLQITGSVDGFAVLPNSAMQYVFTGNIVSNASWKVTFRPGAEQIPQLSSRSFESHTDSQYQSKSDSNQTEVDYLITSEEAAVLPAALCRQLLQGKLVASVPSCSPMGIKKYSPYVFSPLQQDSLVENFLSYALQRVVIPVINDKLGKGFPLPKLAHTMLVRPVIKMNQGHLVISTDVHYKQKTGEDGDLHGHS